MKNIDILGKHKSDKHTKEFILGNGVKLVFNSKRIARYFVSDTNRFLTKCLVVLNSAYADTFYQYRSAWLTTTNGKHGSAKNALATERRVKEMMSSTGDMLDKFNMTLYGSNDPFFSFIDLQNAAMFCKDAAEELSEYFRKRNFTNNAYECQMLADRCKSVHSNLKNYGIDKVGDNPTPPPKPAHEPQLKRRARPYTMDNKPTKN